MNGTVAALRLTLAVRGAQSGDDGQIRAVVADLDTASMVAALAELARLLAVHVEARHGYDADEVLRRALATALADEGGGNAVR
ncbi:MAG: hypothetical protein ACK40J_13175 [Rhodococcus sp. (in: high G+C Gram-positive bacteria)]